MEELLESTTTQETGDDGEEQGSYTWSVASARRMVRDGRAPMLFPESVVRSMVTFDQSQDTHWQLEERRQSIRRKEDIDRPGIAVRLGNRVVLIEGTSRARICLQQHRPFYAYLLTPVESSMCLVETPDLRQARARI